MLKRRGRCKIRIVYAWTGFCFISTLAAYIYSFVAKQKLITNANFSGEKAFMIDLLAAVLFILFVVIVMAVLVVFKVLEHNHSIKIRKPQLFVTYLLGITSAVIGAL